jgi:predicted DNA-binding transcriptional regulator YafY
VAGVTDRNHHLVKYRIDFISELRHATADDSINALKPFVKDSAMMERINSATSVWFATTKQDVTIIAHDELIDTLQKRTIFNNQCIEHKDGQCYVSFTVDNFQDFFTAIARFMPLFDIIKPVEFKEEMKKRIKKYF